jgi:hypothetical protein
MKCSDIECIKMPKLRAWSSTRNNACKLVSTAAESVGQAGQRGGCCNHFPGAKLESLQGRQGAVWHALAHVCARSCQPGLLCPPHSGKFVLHTQNLRSCAAKQALTFCAMPIVQYSWQTCHTPCTMQDLLGQLSHYSEKVRRSSLQGLVSLFTSYPRELASHLAEVMCAIVGRITDADKGVRAALRTLWVDSIQEHTSEAQLAPFLPLLMAHVCSAATHLRVDVRLDAFLFVELVSQHCPHLVSSSHAALVLQLFEHMLAQARAKLLALNALQHCIVWRR